MIVGIAPGRADTLRAPMKNIVILISGRGSNMEAIVRACADERWNARVVAVVSNRADAAGLGFARERGIATAVVDHRAFATRDAFDDALAERIEAHGADIVALAGFMRILGASFVRRFDGRLVNIHPSLLPAFPGLETHRRAIEAGCKASGASVHFVTADLDHGPIIAQAVVPVLADDSDGDPRGARPRPGASALSPCDRLAGRGSTGAPRRRRPASGRCRAADPAGATLGARRIRWPR